MTRTDVRRTRVRRAGEWAAARFVVLASFMVAVACGAMVTCEAVERTAKAAAPTGLHQPETDRPFSDEDRRVVGGILLEAEWLRQHPEAEADLRFDANGDGLVTAADFSAWLAAFQDRVDPPDEPEPPTPPTTGGEGGAYGDGWVTAPASARVYVPPENGRVNNRHFAGEVIRGGRFADRDIGLRLIDCTGTLYIERALFENCRQGLVVNTTTAGKVGLTVHLVECRFVGNYRHQATPGLPAQLAMFYSSGPALRSLGIPTLGIYGCVFVDSGLGSPADRDRYASQYHHHVYPSGNARHVVLDSLFVNASSQAHKGIGSSAEFRRCAVVGGAIGFGAGQDDGQQQRTGRHQMSATVADCVFYGLGDIPADDQRLGWGLVLQSVDAIVERSVFASPQTASEHRPAVRVNRVRDYPVRLTLTDNAFLGYLHAVESFGDGTAWTAEVAGSGNAATAGTAAVRLRSKGLVSGSLGTLAPAPQRLPRLDEGLIARKARAGEITAAEVIGMVRGQMGG